MRADHVLTGPTDHMMDYNFQAIIIINRLSSQCQLIIIFTIIVGKGDAPYFRIVIKNIPLRRAGRTVSRSRNRQDQQENFPRELNFSLR